MTPRDFAYVAHSRCGHVNFIAVEPHQDDINERASLVDDLRFYFESGGWVERITREQLKASLASSSRLSRSTCATAQSLPSLGSPGDRLPAPHNSFNGDQS